MSVLTQAQSAPARTPTATGDADLAISARGLRKSYGSDDKRVDALLGVDLTVRRGEVVGILGANGAGKTTLVEILEGVRPHDAGSARVLSVSVDDAAGMKRLRQRIGISFQHTVLPPLLTVSELIGFQRSLFGQGADVRTLIETVGLSDKARARIGNLSGGQQQRVAVALALVGDPELMFLDEPTSQLDPQARRAVWAALEAQRERRRATILLTTHQMEEAQRLCDRIVIIDHGRVLASGSPAELVERHCPGRVIGFLKPPGTLLPELGSLRAALRSAEDSPQIRLEVDDVNAALGILLDRQRAGSLALDGLRVERRTLEDVFLKLTGREAPEQTS
jgi:ABC-2 type transport system ATP-binding protein